MHDLKLFRDDPAGFDAAMARRGFTVSVEGLSELARTNLVLRHELETLLARKNEIADQVGKAKARGEDGIMLIREGARVNEQINDLNTRLGNSERRVNNGLALFPNRLDPIVPDGRDEADNIVLKEHLGVGVTELPTGAREHFDIGEGLGLDFAGGTKLAGSRFTVMRGQIARMARALGQFMLDFHVENNGYQEVAPPVLVNRNALYGTGQFPKFEEDVFQVGRDLWLAPTSEVMLTNLVAGDMIDVGDLPIRMAALTDCFRREAGSAGKDTRGIIRQHQFQKVELVSIVEPDKSDDEHERMTACAEAILYMLGLPYRRVLLCSGDTGFSARKTYDLEVWMPGAQRWREISSCSNCGDFQARRMNTRVKLDKKNKVFAHTLNGSGVAVGRALAAILENNQREDGTIMVPHPLRDYMGVNSIGN